MTTRRATVVGSGPNGLSAAVALARAGFDVTVVEAHDAIGGGTRTAELTLPGFRHDVCSAVHPAAFTSPFFRAFGMREKVGWLIPDASYAHPLDGGRAAVAWRDLGRTADALGTDARAWKAMLRPLSRRIGGVVDFTGNQMVRVPRHPVTAVRYGLRALELGSELGRRSFRTEEAHALITGVVAHANTALPSIGAAAAGLLLAAQAHADGWGFPVGGAQAIPDALAEDLAAHGGRIRTGERVDDLATLDWGDPRRGDVLVLDASPRLALTLPDVPDRWARAIRRFRYGPGAAKVDFALDGPVPWENADVHRSPTVHVGGTRAEVEASENAVARGRVSERPYVLAAQPSVLDPTRAPAGKSVLWSYIHVPAGSTLDPTELVTRQIERFAPGFRDRVLASHATTATDLAAYNPSAVGGDFSGGAVTFAQLLARPVLTPAPWRTPVRGVYLASGSTSPGPGVHGTAGWLAARLAIADTTGERVGLDDLFG
ncbi:NAD(P)/FAD-dependent oxidoreductase [Microbacterium betulae]|uniref:Pyridine nucleotide-disulfide oxidoreductase domain-containing protein 2 n=1 Tax=Microbacterium betulae TaxID=2981139 RepID=A0AA97FJ94_9MICO|nr:NAD(P)/FAD-dependent oxidoreductase [Microbacterium sp. AB]WOF23983.1 NAD(P)/FAD-dependent oxidoreductase [Microbacterium sp. AB]